MPTCPLSIAPGGHHQTKWNMPPLYSTDGKPVRCFRVQSQTCAPAGSWNGFSFRCVCVCVCACTCVCLKCINHILMEVNDWVFLLIYWKQSAVIMERSEIWETRDTIIPATLSPGSRFLRETCQQRSPFSPLAFLRQGLRSGARTTQGPASGFCLSCSALSGIDTL